MTLVDDATKQARNERDTARLERDLARRERDAAQAALAEVRAALVELNDAMHRYEWDVLGEADTPPKHIALMRRVAAALSAHPAPGELIDDRPLTDDDIAWAKAEIERHENPAPGDK